jgi:hypothetical protein
MTNELMQVIMCVINNVNDLSKILMQNFKDQV